MSIGYTWHPYILTTSAAGDPTVDAGDENGGDENGGDANGGDANGGDANGGDANGGNENGEVPGTQRGGPSGVVQLPFRVLHGP